MVRQASQIGLHLDHALLDALAGGVARERNLLEAPEQRCLVGVDRERLLKVGGVEIDPLQLRDERSLEIAGAPGDAGGQVARSCRLKLPLSEPGQPLADLESVHFVSSVGQRT